ncbi:MAG TPA: valine--tRNA ligase, partial [Desulfobacterales bacterium]|nr:valine--tRNA ligase [Desulfobacterales bacterium]
QEVEQKWYTYWEENRLFEPELPSDKKPYCIVIPPPNVTGTLHMGHALNNTLQDILCRFKRMQGFNVLWQPGTDHAGIATQNVVEKDLASRGLDRHAVGREKFIQLVWEWRERYGGMIINQLKRLGCSCDWSRERFTMDEGLSRAVLEVFVKLYEQGLIYRGDYIINWCPRCHTALADLEVEHEELDSHLYHILYPFKEGEGGLVVATTRPETLLGDTAVAVNPEDPRYKGIAGKYVLLPVLRRPIPIIVDKYVDIEFGTGALKITPAHDPNDFLIGEAHGLDKLKVIDEDGRMNEFAGPYKGIDRFECRKRILEDLKDQGLLVRVEPYRHAVGHCYRCKTMIEPLLSKQWFVRVKPLAERAVDAVRQGKTKIFPDNWEAVYFEWMNNIKDWCISRQIWWGHRIPAWYCKDCGSINVAKEAPLMCESCNSNRLEQETDVLDTWFSSALWPFSTLGWPDDTEELKTFYPTSCLVTGFDILFFWVARMMMMGIHFMDNVPFRHVYIHALVRDAEGKKMSKSKGNVIDPLEVMDQYGTDAFRFTLAALAAQGRDIKLSEDRILGYRHFVNKVWNASRLVLMNLEGYEPLASEERTHSLADKWILSRLRIVTQQVEEALEDYRFNDAANACYQFVWHEFCDWYLEMTKLALYGKDQELRKSAQNTALDVLRTVLKLLHPFMPFVTEEIWQRLPDCEQSIMIAPFPKSSEFPSFPDALKEMELLMGVIGGIRNIRGEMRIPPGKTVSAVIDVQDQWEADVLRSSTHYIRALSKTDSLEIRPGADKPEGSATAVFGRNQVHVLLKGLLDFEGEKKRIKKEIRKVEKDIEVGKRKLSNENFLQKAPPEVVQEVKEKVETLNAKLDKLHQHLEIFEGSQ